MKTRMADIMAARRPGNPGWDDDGVMNALPAPTVAGLLTRWDIAPVALVLSLALAIWYIGAVRRLARRGTSWPVHRSLVFAAGVALFAWTTCGYLQAYATSLFWVWTTQTLTLLLVVPFVVLLGHPLQLARAVSGRDGTVGRILDSRVVRVLSNPLIGPAVIPLLTVALFFGPLSGWAIGIAPVGWMLHIAVVVVGGLVVLPFVGVEDDPSSLAVGLSLAIGSFELVLDAIPGIVLRLSNSLVTSYFAHREVHAWTRSALRDQHLAGTIVWCVSEVIDLPFLALVFHRWVRVDARDAAQVDAVLDAERIAQGRDDAHDPVPADTPWWLTDAEMRRRLGGR
jgi:putative membrane protein